MIGLSIAGAFLLGLMIVWMTVRPGCLNVFEQVGLALGLGLAPIVLGLFIEAVVWDSISYRSVGLVYGLIVGLFTFVCVLKRGFLKSIFSNIFGDFESVYIGFKEVRVLHQILLVMGILFIVLKLVMAFGLNVSHPTITEDGVVTWDMKTKVFFHNKKLVLDHERPDFLGGETKRPVFSPLTDVYFILPYKEFPVGLSNIFSPLCYLSACFLFFGIFFRKTNLNFAVVAAYIVVSLPLVFIHSFTAYFNFPSSLLLFSFAFYLGDQYFEQEESHRLFLIPLTLIVFYCTSIRTENAFLLPALLTVWILYAMWLGRDRKTLKRCVWSSVVLLGCLATGAAREYLNSLSPDTASHFDSLKENIVVAAFSNLYKDPTLFLIPFKQAFLHPDYNILYLIFVLLTVWVLFNIRKKVELKNLVPMFLMAVALMGIVYAALYAYYDRLGLISHYGLRYMLVMVPFMIYFVVYAGYYFCSLGPLKKP